MLLLSLLHHVLVFIDRIPMHHGHITCPIIRPSTKIVFGSCHGVVEKPL